MTCIELQAPRAAFCLLMLFAPVAVLAEPNLNLDQAADIEQQLHDSITTQQAANGPHSEALIPLFAELGHLYRELGQGARAAAAIEEARGVVRANLGLSSLEEAPLIEELIRVEESLGYEEDVWRREQDLLALADAHPDDLRAADIYRELGDRRLQLLSRYFAGEFPLELVLGCYYHRSPFQLDPADRNCTAGSRSALIGAVMAEVWQYYSAAAKTLADHQLYSSAELRNLEMRIVRSAYALGAYFVGRRSLKRLAVYDVADDAPSLARVDSLLDVADWDMIAVHGGSRFRWGAALDTYEQAYAKLRSDGVDAGSIKALFAPDVPVVLPTFLPNPLVTQRTSDTTGHIDVTFEVTRYGRARRVEIVDSTTDASRQAERELVHQISRSVFRPRVIDGQVADAAPVAFRYYVTPTPQ
jgi:tetratricopeptide (TPR) repeat protein